MTFIKKPTTIQPTFIPTIQNNGSFIYKEKIQHQVETTIQHWQLRDLVSTSSSHIVLLPKHNQLQMYDTLKKQVIKNIDLPFAPMSVDTMDGYIAIAGPRGLAMIKHIETDWSSDVFHTGAGMNNSIGLSKINHDLRVTICNNNHTVHIYSIPSMKVIQVLNCPSAINHTSVSLNEKYMLATSDIGDVYQYEINHDQYELKSTVKVSNEPCLGCAWHPSNLMYAVTSQDGQVNIFHAVTGEKLCQLMSSETRKTRKAARCVSFSKGPYDLMAYSEHVSQVNIVDTRTFETRQIIRLSPAEDLDVHIAGLSFSPNNQSLFIAMEDNMMELKLDLIARRQFPTPLSNVFM
ncbi:unnamed protein product [Cunninghamella blakesleeana]